MRTMLMGLVLLCACTIPAGPPPPVPTTVPAAPTADVETVARELVDEVNRARRANGVARLRRDPRLDRAALEHAQELATRRTLDHTSTDPARRTMTMRIEAAGGTWSSAAENLANMSGPASGVAARTVQGWLGSAGHRRNMLGGAYTDTGVGVALDRRGIWYITQLYVLPRAGR